MNDQQHLDFVAALGDEFCTVLECVPGIADLSPQDGYEVFSRVLGERFEPSTLRTLPESMVAQLASAAASILECEAIGEQHIRNVISRTLSRL